MALIFAQRMRVSPVGLMFWLAACSAITAAEKPGYFRIVLPSGDTIMAQIQGAHLRVGATMEQLNASKPYKGQANGPAISFRPLDLPVASNALPAGCARIQVDNLQTVTAPNQPTMIWSRGTLIMHYPDNSGAPWTYHANFTVQLGENSAAAPVVRVPKLDQITLEVVLRPGAKKSLGVGMRVKADNTVLDDIRQKNKSVEVGLTLTDTQGKHAIVKPPPALSQLGFG